LIAGLIWTENFGWLVFSVFVIGTFNVPLLPLGLDFVCEITFPVGEAFASGILISGG